MACILTLADIHEMRKQLTLQEVNSTLSRGKTVEIFLGRINEDKEIISWLGVELVDGLIVTTQYYVYDEGNLNYLDLYSFSYVDPDMEFPRHEFNTLEQAFVFLESRYKMPSPKFVNSGLIQNEYKDLLGQEQGN